MYQRDDDGIIIDSVTPLTIPNSSPIALVDWEDESPETIYRVVTGQNPWTVKAHVSPEILSTRRLFEAKRLYVVRASAGWKRVPDNVSEAARILIDDYFSPSGKYHEYGVTVLRSADYRMEFAEDPFSTTGNIIADQLLSNYINWGVHVF